MATWDSITNLPNNLIGGALSGVSQKAGEIAGKMNWSNTTNAIDPTNTFKTYGLGNVIPTDFKAVTTNLLTQSAQSSLNSIGSGVVNNIGSFGASNLTGLVGPQQPQSGESNFVKLISQNGDKDSVVFNVMPNISESRSASYEEVSIAQHPGAILKYQTTSARTWGVGGIKLISRNEEEANRNQEIINILRSWLMPYYGAGTANSAGPSLFGAPPDVLTFSAYGDTVIGPVSVVLESLNINWSNDVDYIHTSSGQAFPVILSFDISLKEAWSPKEFSGFDIAAYKKGDMKNSYNPTSSSASSSDIGAKTEPTPLMNDSTSGVLAQVTPQKIDMAEPKLFTPLDVINKMASAPPAFDPKAYATQGLNFSINPGVNQNVREFTPPKTGFVVSK